MGTSCGICDMYTMLNLSSGRHMVSHMTGHVMDKSHMGVMYAMSHIECAPPFPLSKLKSGCARAPHNKMPEAVLVTQSSPNIFH